MFWMGLKVVSSCSNINKNEASDAETCENMELDKG